MDREYNINPETRIRMVCQACGYDDNQTNAWRTHCGLHGGPVCIDCCWNCEHRFTFSGLTSCKYKTPMQKRMAAVKKKQAEFKAEAKRINDAVEARRKKKAKEYAIKMAKKRKREDRKKAAANNR